jgi:ribosomal protein S27E
LNLPPIDTEQDGVVQLKVPFKKPVPEDRMLVVEPRKCFHGPYVIDEAAAEVTCKACGEKLNPMYVLAQLASKESRYHAAAARYQDEMRRLNERSKTKCRHCQKMTPISHA